METKTTNSHNLSLKDRKNLEMNGVKEVISFNDTRILLHTYQGTLDIKGKDLNIQKLNLDDSQIKIEGYVNNLEYTNKSTETNFIKKLFR